MYDKLWEFLNEMDICMFIILLVFLNYGNIYEFEFIIKR